MQFYNLVRHFEGHLINELLQRLSNKNKILSQKKEKEKKGYVTNLRRPGRFQPRSKFQIQQKAQCVHQNHTENQHNNYLFES